MFFRDKHTSLFRLWQKNLIILDHIIPTYPVILVPKSGYNGPLGHIQLDTASDN